MATYVPGILTKGNFGYKGIASKIAAIPYLKISLGLAKSFRINFEIK